MKLRELERIYMRQLFEDPEGADDPTDGDTGTGTGSEEKKYTDAEVEDLINKKFAEWEKRQKKTEDEAARLAGMNAQQRAEHERDELEKKYNDLLKQNTIATLTVQARKMLSDGGVNGVPDELVAVLVTEDADTTKANVDAFVKLFKQSVQEAVKNANRKPSPKTGATGGTLTKADILKVEDINERQKLIRENMDLFR